MSSLGANRIAAVVSWQLLQRGIAVRARTPQRSGGCPGSGNARGRNENTHKSSARSPFRSASLKARNSAQLSIVQGCSLPAYSRSSVLGYRSRLAATTAARCACRGMT